MKKSNLKNKSILITGITGFVGSSLSRRLEKEGSNVFGISTSVESKNIFKTNIIDFKKVKEIIEKKKISICYHLAGESIVEAGQKNPYDTFMINTQGTLNLLEIARVCNLEKIIISSSSHVYGGNTVPYKEYYSPKPSRPYETSKAVTDMIAQSYSDTFSLPVMIGRFVNIYGPGDLHFTRLIPKTIKSILENKNPQMWGGDILRQYLYIDDAVDAYVKLAEIKNEEVGKNKIFNFGSNNTYTVREVIEKIIELSKSTVHIDKIESMRELEIKAQYVSSSKAARLLNWKPKVSLNEGLSQTIDWYKDYFKVL